MGMQLHVRGGPTLRQVRGPERMLPLTVAHQLRGTLLDYLRTTFGFKDEQLERALFALLG